MGWGSQHICLFSVCVHTSDRLGVVFVWQIRFGCLKCGKKKKSGRVDLVSRSRSLSDLSHRCAGYFGVGLRVIFNSNKDSCQHLLEAAVYSCGCLAFASLV